MTPEMNARANVLLNAIAAEMRAQGRNVEVRHQVGEEFEATFGKDTYGSRGNPCLFLDGVSCQVSFRKQSSGGYYHSPPAASRLLQVDLEGVRNQKTYGSLKTSRSWKEALHKDGTFKPMDVKKMAEAIILYADTRKAANDEYEAETNQARRFQDTALYMKENGLVPNGVTVSGSVNGFVLDFRTQDADKMTKVLEALRAALA